MPTEGEIVKPGRKLKKYNRNMMVELEISVNFYNTNMRNFSSSQHYNSRSVFLKGLSLVLVAKTRGHQDYFKTGQERQSSL